MKHLLAVVLVLVLALGMAGGVGASVYDVAAMPTDELRELKGAIDEELTRRDADSAVSADFEPIVLCDESGVYVEYRGLKSQGTNEWQLIYYMTNDTGDTIDVFMDNVQADGCNVPIGNMSSGALKPGSKYLSTANYDFFFDAERAKEYGLTRCEQLEFDIVVRPWGKELRRYPAKLELGIEIE